MVRTHLEGDDEKRGQLEEDFEEETSGVGACDAAVGAKFVVRSPFEDLVTPEYQ